MGRTLNESWTARAGSGLYALGVAPVSHGEYSSSCPGTRCHGAGSRGTHGGPDRENENS